MARWLRCELLASVQPVLCPWHASFCNPSSNILCTHAAATRHLTPSAGRAAGALSWALAPLAYPALWQHTWGVFKRCHCNARAVPTSAASSAHPRTFVPCSQVVITDIEECLERLSENVAVSLPPTAHLTDASEAVETAVAEAEQSDAARQRGLATVTDELRTAPASAASQRSPGWDGKTCVHVEELDWRQSARHLRAPYDVVLVADVVCGRHSMDCCSHLAD